MKVAMNLRVFELVFDVSVDIGKYLTVQTIRLRVRTFMRLSLSVESEVALEVDKSSLLLVSR